MRLTHFKRLRNAIANLDVNFIVNSVRALREELQGQGRPFDRKEVVITEEGIYYINARSGVATKVVLYLSDHEVVVEGKPEKQMTETGYTEPEVIEQFTEYHLLRCNLLTKAEMEGWKGNYRVAQRVDGKFFFRLVDALPNPDGSRDVFHEIESQQLNVCKNCLIKINSLLGRVLEFSQDDFELRYFFDSGFAVSWRAEKNYSRERGSLSDMKPVDLEHLYEIRKEQAHYICESCNLDMSPPKYRKYAFIQPIDHLVNKVSYVRLRCLCIHCRSEEADGEKYKKLTEYESYLRRVGRPDLD